jgi:hypothetical protein
MKETADLVYSNSLCAIVRERKRTCWFQPLHAVKRAFVLFREELLSGLATVGIGTVFLLSIYLFFTQLAEYGW